MSKNDESKSDPGCARYVVADDIKYRREDFGAVTLDVVRQETRFFNRTAAHIIEHCRSPVSAAEIARTIPSDCTSLQLNIPAFLTELVEKNIVKICAIDDTTDAQFFFTDIEEFSEDNLHTPLGVEIELTLRCLRSCQYCSYDAHPKVDRSGELQVGDWHGILTRLRDAGVYFVRFTGGDPLLHPDFAQIVGIADALGLIVTVGSDLTDLNAGALRALADCRNLFALQTTLDGASEASADRLRGRGNYQAVLRGLEGLYAVGVPVIVGTVLTRDNIDEIPAIGQLVGSLGAAGYCVAPLYAAGRAQSPAVRALIPDDADLARAARLFRTLIGSGVVASADPSWLDLTATLPDESFDRLWEHQPDLVRRPDRLLRIDPRGRAYASIKLKPRHGDSIYLGDIKSRDLVELWNTSPFLNGMRNATWKETYFGSMIDKDAVFPRSGGPQ